jgi:hypothetical protein
VKEKVAAGETAFFDTTPFAAEPQRRGQSGWRQKVTASPGLVGNPACFAVSQIQEAGP